MRDSAIPLLRFCEFESSLSGFVFGNPWLVFYGPKREIPYAHSFGGTITATFYADKYLRQRTFMEMWQKMIVNTLSNNMNFYDDPILPC